MKIKTLFPVFLLILVCNACDFSLDLDKKSNNTKTLIQGKTMGTTYHIALIHLKITKIDPLNLQKNIDDLLVNLNQKVSTYISSSQITQFNESSNKSRWTKIDQDFFKIVTAAQNISKLSNGAFDITVSPLIDLWGFGKEIHDYPPSSTEIKNALSHIGHQKLQLNPENLSLRKTHEKLRIDLSAIAKGFAVDKVSQLLTDKGYSNHLVEIGGELRVSGTNQAGNKWRIAIEQPDLTTSIAKQGIEITNRAVATSGDYRNYFVEKGLRRSHIINPKTGYPITHNLASVTVLHDSTMLADAYATALIVMGEKQGKLFAEENNLDVLMIIRSPDKESDKFEFWSSSKLFH